MGVHDGHRERLRARFLKQGLESFAEHEALELLLFYARPRCNTNELAHALLAHFGSFSAVMDAPVQELVKVAGIGEPSAVLLKMIPEMGAYYLNNRSKPGMVLNSTVKAGEFFMPKFLGKRNEEMWMASLDNSHKLLRCVRVTDDGIVNAVRISIKRIVAEALSANATSVILAHNHPAGLALPSMEDKNVTRQIFAALRTINVNLSDHIVVADNDFVSMADSGLLDNIRQ